MSKNKRDLTSDERKLWRKVAAGVKARKPLAPVEDEAPEPPVSRIRAKQTPPAPPPAPKRVAAPPPANRAGEKRVRRGQVEIGASLDLHGHTQDSARAALARFLRAAHKRGDRTVIVVTGVGRGGEGVLKRRLPDWLSDADIRPLVSGFAQAHRAHGGAGAFYVFLKRPRATDS